MARKYRGVTPAKRRAVFVRDDFTCRRCRWRPQLIPADYDGRYTICGQDASGRSLYLEMDHVVPVARGGGFTTDNFQTLCNRCNAQKGAND